MSFCLLFCGVILGADPGRPASICFSSLLEVSGTAEHTLTMPFRRKLAGCLLSFSAKTTDGEAALTEPPRVPGCPASSPQHFSAASRSIPTAARTRATGFRGFSCLMSESQVKLGPAMGLFRKDSNFLSSNLKCAPDLL